MALDAAGAPDGLGLGLVQKCDTVLAHYEGVASHARDALYAKAQGLYGKVFGPDQQSLSELGQIIDNSRRGLKTLRDRVLAGQADFDNDLVAYATREEARLQDVYGLIIDTSLEQVLATGLQNAGQDVKSAINASAGAAATFAFAAIPWWVWAAGIGFVVFKVVQVRRAVT